MREILFRGQTRKNGEKVKMATGEKVPGHWVYGGIFPGTWDYSIIYGGETEDDLEKHVVYSETVGQYTGLKDKNGKRIFEGDIVCYNTFNDFNCYSVVKFGEYEQDGSEGEYAPHDCVGWYAEVNSFTCPDWAENDPIYFPDYLKQQNLLEVNQGCEVIGNIYDNYDLLEEPT